MPDEPREIQTTGHEQIERRSLTTALLADAATIIGPVAAVYTGYKLTHKDEPKADPPQPAEQPPQEQPDDQP
jgi:hypothetical protein